MKVVVVGATGNVGTSVVEALAGDPAITEIVGVARRTPSSWQPAKTRFEAVDVRSPEIAQHLQGADALVLLTWAFQPTHQPLTTWDTNVLGSINALQAGGLRSQARSFPGLNFRGTGAFTTELPPRAIAR